MSQFNLIELPRRDLLRVQEEFLTLNRSMSFSQSFIKSTNSFIRSMAVRPTFNSIFFFLFKNLFLFLANSHLWSVGWSVEQMIHDLSRNIDRTFSTLR